MHDLVIRGGTVVDGTGGPAREADVAIDDGRCWLLAHETDVRSDVDTPAFDAFDVLRQAKDAVAVRAIQIGFGHELCNGSGIFRR